MGSSQQSILLVENDAIIARGLIWALEQEGYIVKHTPTVKEAIENLETESYCLALLEMQLPDGSGCQVQDVLREKSVPLIYLSTIADKLSIVRALESGAADYVTKPFDLRELLARINKTLALGVASKAAVTRDCTATSSHTLDVIDIDSMRIDTVAAKVFLKEGSAKKKIALTALEYRLLLLLAINRGRLLTRRSIIDKIWDEHDGFVEDNTLSTYIKTLRKKLKGAMHIETVRGMGYRLS